MAAHDGAPGGPHAHHLQRHGNVLQVGPAGGGGSVNSISGPGPRVQCPQVCMGGAVRTYHIQVKQASAHEARRASRCTAASTCLRPLALSATADTCL